MFTHERMVKQLKSESKVIIIVIMKKTLLTLQEKSLEAMWWKSVNEDWNIFKIQMINTQYFAEMRKERMLRSKTHANSQVE